MNIDKRELRRMGALTVFGEWNCKFGGPLVFAYLVLIYSSGNSTQTWRWEGEQELPSYHPESM